MTETTTIDDIVARVLRRLSRPGGLREEGPAPVALSPPVTPRETQAPAPVPVSDPGVASVPVAVASLDAAVITADILLTAATGGSTVTVTPRAIITPAAQDVARERGLEIVRQASPQAPSSAVVTAAAGATTVAAPAAPKPGALIIVVRHTEHVQRLTSERSGSSRVEIAGCPDDAAALAISALCRGDAASAIIFAEQTHRAACLANRNERVKAVAVLDVGEARRVHKQLRANVWCIDPTGRSYFELHNLLRAIPSS